MAVPVQFTGGLKTPGVRAVAELAESRGIKDCLQTFSREKHWINEQHLQLCRIAAPTFFEQKRAEWMAAQFRALGCEAKLDRAGNVLAWLNGSREGPFIALTAHLDTVLAPRSPEDISVTPDGRYLGPGVADNGAGLAALLAVARAFKTSAPLAGCSYPLLLVANVCEEGEGNLSGMRYLCRQSPLASKIRAFLVLDGPATDHVTCHALASRRFEISFNGPGGHSWSDYGVGNPVHALGRAVSMFTEIPVNGDSPPRSSVNFGTIEGGLSINSIPAAARAKVDIRSESVERIEDLASQLSVVVERAVEIENQRATSGKISAKLREIGFRPGGHLADDAPIMTYLRAVDGHLGIRSKLDCASTDANIPLSMGLPALSIGAGGQGGGAHTPSEWFHPDGRETALKRITLALCLLMQEPEAAKLEE